MTLNDLGRRDEALVAAERAVVLDPLSAIINAVLGGARASVGRFDDALVAYRQAIEIDPGDGQCVLQYRRTVCVRIRTTRHGDALVRESGQPRSGQSRDPGVLAQAHWELGDDTEAGRWLARTLAIGEGTACTNFIAALLYLDRGDEASARKHAQRAAELDPWNMFLIRDHDLRKGDYATARARYAKAFPELFAKELPRLTRS